MPDVTEDIAEYTRKCNANTLNWSNEEDEALVSFIGKNTAGSWIHVARLFDFRSPLQCFQRTYLLLGQETAFKFDSFKNGLQQQKQNSRKKVDRVFSIIVNPRNLKPYLNRTNRSSPSITNVNISKKINKNNVAGNKRNRTNRSSPSITNVNISKKINKNNIAGNKRKLKKAVRRKRKKPRYPQLKRPINAMYTWIHSTNQRKLLTAKFPDLKSGDITRKMYHMWKCEIPKNQKEKYLEKYREQLAEYNEKVKQLDNEQAKQTQEETEMHEFLKVKEEYEKEKLKARDFTKASLNREKIQQRNEGDSNGHCNGFDKEEKKKQWIKIIQKKQKTVNGSSDDFIGGSNNTQIKVSQHGENIDTDTTNTANAVSKNKKQKLRPLRPKPQEGSRSLTNLTITRPTKLNASNHIARGINSSENKGRSMMDESSIDVFLQESAMKENTEWCTWANILKRIVPKIQILTVKDFFKISDEICERYKNRYKLKRLSDMAFQIYVNRTEKKMTSTSNFVDTMRLIRVSWERLLAVADPASRQNTVLPCIESALAKKMIVLPVISKKNDNGHSCLFQFDVVGSSIGNA